MNTQRILVDANALSDLFVGEAGLHASAERLRRTFSVWLAPPLIRYEFGNVLRNYVRSGRKTEADTLVMLGKGIEMIRFCGEPPVDAILREADYSGLTFYDAVYVACARELKLTLYTRDEAILKNCAGVARRISEL